MSRRLLSGINHAIDNKPVDGDNNEILVFRSAFCNVDREVVQVLRIYFQPFVVLM